MSHRSWLTSLWMVFMTILPSLNCALSSPAHSPPQPRPCYSTKSKSSLLNPTHKEADLERVLVKVSRHFDLVSTSSSPRSRIHIVLVGSETSFDYDENGRYLKERRAPRIMSDKTPPLVPPLLNIKQISLLENSPGEWNGSGDFSMNSNNLEQDLQSAFAAVSSPTLESVHLRGIVV
ncbi:hypothetical protein B0H14DRAFT_2569391 [Mycena olivaceomarginata]|nr:hypothetical protein B0H14DRAFT_2569391 [Mycena olivaceomarginata]